MSTAFNHNKYHTISKMAIPHTYYYETRNIQPTYTISKHTNFGASAESAYPNWRRKKKIVAFYLMPLGGGIHVRVPLQRWVEEWTEHHA
jgi:hypothetical protein